MVAMTTFLVKLLNNSISTRIRVRVGNGTIGKLAVSSIRISHHGCHGNIFENMEMARIPLGSNFQIPLSPLLVDLDSWDWHNSKAVWKHH